MMNSLFTGTKKFYQVLTWVYSIAVLLPLIRYTRYRRAHDPSVREKIHTAPLDNIQKTFTPYDVINYENALQL